MPTPPDGVPVSWGDNNFGGAGIGDASSGSVRVPTPLALPAGRTVLTATRNGTPRLLILDDELVYAVGDNLYGELGQGTTDSDDHPTPIAVRGVGGVGSLSAVMVAAGATTNLALLADGTVVGWGRNNHAVVGDGTTTQRTLPVATSGLTNIVQIAASVAGEAGYALDSGGAVWAWGDNTYGQLALGTVDGVGSPPYTTPQATLWTADVVAISATQNGIAALKTDGTVEYAGAALVGGGADSGTPAALSGFADIVVLATGTGQVYGLLADGSGVGTGANSEGEITGDAADPTSVTAAALPVADLVDISGGTLFTIAIDADGTVWSWGHSFRGELGRGEAFNVTLPPGAVCEGAGNRVATASSNGFAYLVEGFSAISQSFGGA